MHEHDSPHYGCIGVGVGPANLSLASLLHGDQSIPSLFLEQKEYFSWHDGQQLPGTTLQVSMLKDLVSLADPTNRFSFLSYLHAHGKIYHFINAQFDAMPRQEYRNYLRWASEQNENVLFNEKVLSVDFDGDSSGTFVVETDRRRLTADNISVGIGTSPWIPPVAPAGPHDDQFHVCDIVDKGRGLGGKRVCVVGGGQSGAEVFLDLISRPEGERPRRVSWVSRRRNYFPMDDSPFTNDFYMPSYSDYFARLDRTTREQLNAQHVLTSDGISEATLREVYQQIYVHRFVEGDRDLVALYPGHSVAKVERGAVGDWSVEIRSGDHPGTATRFETDVVVWATGFRPATPAFLEPLAGRLEREGEEYRIDDSFAVRWDGPGDRNIFVHNAAQGQRGLADRNLSLVAWRSQRIADRMRGVRTDEPADSFLDWAPKAHPSEAAQGVGG
ncbi:MULTISPECIES: lysine N(6)-hydroxylase/L-ornithine N(5)-oxygenase family protein [Streptomyces]|uniref:L-lysine N6-monooxygenase MbtG n=1 Tax=Streptomyces levis TaxID=285566 RepID=A0ABN3P4L7_9ACTN|nr:SidA/IucD/PvdA family monooxygenase [Streptomyces sp. XY006]OXS31011.1 L-lysine 6-monooxygenase [Streptomyces sp. XY006]